MTAIHPNTQQKSSMIKVLPKLTLTNTYLCYSSSNTFDVKLVDNNGNADKGKTISFNINGYILKATTDPNGIAKCPLSILKKGTYTITATYDENIISHTFPVGPGSVSVIKNIGNPNAKKIAYVVGLHPLEYQTHDTLVKLLPTIPGFNYCYDMYVVKVTENVGHYGDGAGDNNPGRQNGQNLAYKYVYPQIVNGSYKAAIDIHSNVGAYPYKTFVFSPITGSPGEKYASEVAGKCENISYYSPPSTTSGPFLTEPLNQNGVPAFYLEEYSFADQSTKDMHMKELISAVDSLKF